ncbi:MAG: sugar-binding protein [Methylacidiphilales bacterium]|nr:sugar-binding protein [Candidatus Methylacidiphilales bacterium]
MNQKSSTSMLVPKGSKRSLFVCAALAFAAAFSWSLPVCAADVPAVLKNDFEGGTELPAGWTSQGNVTIDTTQGFKGKNSLMLGRTPEESGKPCSAASPAFRITPGAWKMDLACKSDLKSPDSSFDGVVTLEYLSGNTVLDQVTLADIYGLHAWQPISKQLQPPRGADSARVRIQINKASGKFWIDEISASLLSAVVREPSPIDRMYFSHDGHGHFLYPEDSRAFKVTVETTKPLPADQVTVSCILTDYWGAEQAEPIAVQLAKAPGLRNGRTPYEGTVDFGKIPLEIGKYYEIHGEIARAGDEPYRNYSSFVIEPEAAANSYKAAEIPFSSRNWDGRIGETFEIAHRIGIRIMCIWSGWAPTPPYKPNAPCIELVEKYKMGAIFGVPSGTIEGHGQDWEKYDEKALREGTRNLITTYRKMAEPFILSLGNEPAVLADRIPADVQAYKAIYEEAKKTDPSVFVVGTSIGGTEEFFKAGFGKYCDAYDFHCYEAPRNVADAFPGYQKLFKKYGDAKQIWSTEIGLNSQGVSRNIVAIDMIRKFALFFAGGGVNISWFDLFYPDGDAKLIGSSGESFNVIDSRYLQYAPRLTGVTYYDLVNAICIKKFVEQKQYGDDIHAFLFRDRDNRQLQIIWKDKGRKDVFLPLPDVKKLQVIRIGGEHRDLNPGGKGVTLSIDEEPLLLLYDGTTPLAANLGEPLATVSVPSGMVRAASSDVTVRLSGATADDIDLVAPPFWQVKKSVSGKEVKFTVTCPEATTVRQADIKVTLGNKENRQGELYLRPPVTGQLTEQILPVPSVDGKPPGVKLILKNNGQKSQNVSWEVSLLNQLPLSDGRYGESAPVSDAHFTEAANGQLNIEGGAQKEFVLPLAGTDSQTVYRVHAGVTDASDRNTASERYVAGFVAVPKAGGEVKLDGTLDSPDWKKAPVEKIDEKRQYFSYDPKIASWKGPEDLSGTIRFLWDDKYLYAGVEVTDDIAGSLQEDGAIWQQDSLQFLVDPCRAMEESVGKYDYGVAVGKKGPQAFCFLSADAAAPVGDARDILVSAKRKDEKSGSMTYVVVFPWSRLAPFKPSVGADLGLTMLLNEDDGKGRKSFMTWFGDASSKRVDIVGDLILTSP